MPRAFPRKIPPARRPRVLPPTRADGAEARARLVSTALRLFAESGYKGASTRAICEAAGVNLASIRYYFGDKSGLYRAAFSEPLSLRGGPNDPRTGERGLAHGGCMEPGATLSPESLAVFFRRFLAPLKQGEELGRVMKLHFREMIEPTGAWDEAIESEIKPEHAMLARMIADDFGLDRVDLDVHRLAFCVIGMAVHFFVGRPIVEQIAPGVLATPRAIDTLAERMSIYASGMIEADRARRGLAAGSAK